MMSRQGQGLLIGGIVVGFVAAWALGVPLGILLVVVAILACPLAMYFGMGGMGMRHESHHERMDRPSHPPDAGRRTEEHERHTPHRN
jgi:hypothetical protein